MPQEKIEEFTCGLMLSKNLYFDTLEFTKITVTHIVLQLHALNFVLIKVL